MVSNIIKRANLLSIFFIWRAVLFTPMIIASYIISYNLSSPVSYIYKYINNPNLSLNAIFLFPWANFDGIHYINIAEYSYTNQARFFPLFPLLMSVLPSEFMLRLLLVNTLFFLALFVFKKLIEIDFPNIISKKVILYLLLFPTSFFFVSIYSEGLFLLLTLSAFYLARRNMWFWSVICVMLLTATRFVGIAILPALFYEFVITNGIRNKKILIFLLAPLGLAVYSLFNYYKWNNFFYFIQAQGELGNNRVVNSLIFFPQTIFRYIKILSTVPFSYEWGIALFELVSFLLTAFLLYFAWKKKIRVSYLIFAAINFAIIISTGTFSGLPRYVLTIFPIFIALALIKNKIFTLAYVIFSPILLFILLMLFSRGYFVA